MPQSTLAKSPNQEVSKPELKSPNTLVPKLKFIPGTREYQAWEWTGDFHDDWRFNLVKDALQLNESQASNDLADIAKALITMYGDKPEELFQAAKTELEEAPQVGNILGSLKRQLEIKLKTLLRDLPANNKFWQEKG